MLKKMITSGASWLPLIVLVASLLALTFVFNTTTPTETGAVGVFLIFILFYIVSLTSTYIVLLVGKQILMKIPIKLWSSSSDRKLYYSASILAFVPVLFVAMQSVGGMELRDVLLLAAFVIVVLFYIVKRL